MEMAPKGLAGMVLGWFNLITGLIMKCKIKY